MTDIGRDSLRDPLSCMEVWGGNRETDSSFSLPGLDVWLTSHRHDRPATDCGDVHYLSSCASGRITRMLLADVCGQRQVSQELAAELRSLMMRNINAIGQSRFIRQMHQQLRRFSHSGGYATAIISTYFAPRRTFTLCNAGHPAPLIFRAATGEWSVMKTLSAPTLNDGTIPLGVIDHGEYQQFSTRLNEGDMVLCYSNSLTECRDENGQIIGIEGISQYLGRSEAKRPAKLLSDFVSRLTASDSAAMSRQDATLLLCRATTRTVGWKNNLMAPLRLLGSVTDSTTLR